MADPVAELVEGHRADVSVSVIDPAGDRDLGLPPDRVLQIGSVTKVFTGLLLAQEVTAGRLALDQPVADLLPPRVRLPATDLRLAELATHTSGLPRLPPGLLRRPRSRDPYAAIDADALYGALTRCRLRGRGRASYSNLGMGLLGHALCLHAGREYGDLVADRIGRPIAMADTVTSLDAEQRARRVPGGGRAGAPWTFDALSGAGALWSTAGDLRRFLRAHVEPDAAMAMALAPRVRHPGPGDTWQGLGWVVLGGSRADRRLAWHNGGTSGYRSFVGLHPATRRGVAVLAATNRSVDRLGLSLLRAIGAHA